MEESAPGPQAASPDPNDIWACYEEGEDGAHDMFITGSRGGLLRLKEHIEKAIESGESLMHEESGIDFAGVRRVDQREVLPATSSWRERALPLGCFGILIAILVFALLGVISVFRD